MYLKSAIIRILVFTNFLCFCNYWTTNGQNYLPLIDTSKVWYVFEEEIYPPTTTTTIWKISSDTIWNEINYKKVFRSVDSLQINWSLHGMIREDTTRKVYFKYLADTSERLLYDFNVEVGDSLYIQNDTLEPLIVGLIDTVSFNEIPRRRYKLYLGSVDLNITDEIWIEGIGSLFGLIYSGYAGSSGMFLELLCFYGNDTLIYQNPNYESCFISTYVDDDGTTHESSISVNIYPHPITNNSIFEIINARKGNFDIKFYDVNGHLIEFKHLRNINCFTISKNDFIPGVYLFKVFNRGKFIFSDKIIVL